MNSKRVAVLALTVAFSAGCYHATIETGLTPGSQVIDNPMAPSWIAGLVPPSTVSTASQCPGGAAIVETQVSFVNGLIAMLTLQIFTPMSIKVTCAAGGGDAPEGLARVTVPDWAPPGALQSAIDSATALSVRRGAPVIVEFRR